MVPVRFIPRNMLNFVSHGDLNMVFIVRSVEITWNGRPSYPISVAKQMDLPHLAGIR